MFRQGPLSFGHGHTEPTRNSFSMQAGIRGQHSLDEPTVAGKERGLSRALNDIRFLMHSSSILNRPQPRVGRPGIQLPLGARHRVDVTRDMHLGINLYQRLTRATSSGPRATCSC